MKRSYNDVAQALKKDMLSAIPRTYNAFLDDSRERDEIVFGRKPSSGLSGKIDSFAQQSRATAMTIMCGTLGSALGLAFAAAATYVLPAAITGAIGIPVILGATALGAMAGAPLVASAWLGLDNGVGKLLRLPVTSAAASFDAFPAYKDLRRKTSVAGPV